MRKILLVVASFLLASGVVAQSEKFQPLNTKTGLWDVAENFTITGLPPNLQAMYDQMTLEQRAKMGFGGASQTRDYKWCVTAKDLNTNPYDDKCKWTVLTSTSTDMDLRSTTCDMGKNQDQDIKPDVRFQNPRD